MLAGRIEKALASASSPRVLDYLSSLCKTGRLDEALELLELEHIPISRDNAFCLLQQCSRNKDLDRGKRVQSLMVFARIDSVEILGNHLIRLFASCGCLDEANQAFYKILHPSVYSWSAIISAHANLGSGADALLLYSKMQLSGIKADKCVYLAVLKGCGMTGALQQGREIHHQVLGSGIDFDVVIGSTLINMYAKCRSLEESRDVLEGLQTLNVVCWGAMISGCAEHGEDFLALDCFQKMQKDGVRADKVIFLSTLKACGHIECIEQGRLIHGQILLHIVGSDAVLESTLVDMYAKCGSLQESHKVFRNMTVRDVVAWDAVITGYVQHDEGVLALESFHRMQEEGIKPDKVTFPSILKACIKSKAIQQGRLIHGSLISLGLQADTVVGNTLVDMYAKCNSLEESCKVFDNLWSRDVLSWDVMIAGYAQNDSLLAFDCFEEMQLEGVEPDNFTFSIILKVFGSLGATGNGRLMHDQILKHGLDSDVVGNALVDMYVKCGCLDESRRIFDKLLNRNIISWCAMIAGYAQNCEGLLALECFEKMEEVGIKPNEVAISSILTACGNIGAITQGRLIHEQALELGLNSDTILGSILVDMYAKCGVLKESETVFDKLERRNVVIWNSMIAGYAQHGDAFSAINCSKKMQEEGLRPDDVTFLLILVACGRASSTDTACWQLGNMTEHHRLLPDSEHYNCLIDLLGHAGWLKEAEDLLQQCLIETPGISGWISLLSACRTFFKMELGRHCFDEATYLDPNCAPAYVLMSNIYADAYMQKDVDKIENLRRRAGVFHDLVE